ncbi:FimV-like protein [Aromatoleum petrolei]|nr:FimV-like protein [Aromatoleum petrolei]
MATPKPAPVPAQALAPEPVEEPGFVQGLLGDPAVLAGGGGILALLLAYAGIKARQRRKQDTEHGGESVASEFPLPTNSVFGATGGQSVNTGESSVLHTDFSQSGLSAIDTDEGVDPVAEADVYMAYGRDAQAEEILLDALKSDGSRMAIYVKLLEIYAQRKNLKAFENTATDLYSRTGGDGGDWDKAAEMGRRLDPDNPLYRASAGGGTPTTGLVTGALGVGGLASAAVGVADSAAGPAASFAAQTPAAHGPVLTEIPGDAGIEALPEVDAGALDFDLDAGLDLGSADAAVETPMPQLEAAPSIEAPHAVEDAPSFDLDVGGIVEQASEKGVAAADPDPMLATVIGQGMDFAAADQALEFDLAPELDVAAPPAGGEVSLDQTMISPDGAPAMSGPAVAEDLEKTSFDSSLLDFDFNLDGGVNQPSAIPPALDLTGIDLNLEAASLASSDGTADDGSDAAASAGGLAPGADVIEEVNTKLELARAYEEMGDTEGARELIEEVLREGSAEQREAAALLAQRLG